MGRFQKLEKTAGAGVSAVPGSAPVDAPPVSQGTTQADYPAAIAVADEAFFRGDYKAALRHYSRALQSDSTQMYPWIGQLNALLALRQYKEAEVWSNRALELFPEDATVLSQRARVLAHTGNIKRAIGVSDYAVSKGSSEWAWLARGEVLLVAKNGNSKFCFDKAVEVAGAGNWQIPYLAGLVHIRANNYSGAVELMALAAERNLRHAQLWRDYSAVLAKLNFTERAREAARRAQELEPNSKGANRLQSDVEERSVVEKLMGFLRR